MKLNDDDDPDLELRRQTIAELFEADPNWRGTLRQLSSHLAARGIKHTHNAIRLDLACSESWTAEELLESWAAEKAEEDAEKAEELDRRMRAEELRSVAARATRQRQVERLLRRRLAIVEMLKTCSQRMTLRQIREQLDRQGLAASLPTINNDLMVLGSLDREPWRATATVRNDIT